MSHVDQRYFPVGPCASQAAVSIRVGAVMFAVLGGSCGTHGALIAPCAFRPEPMGTAVVVSMDISNTRIESTWDGLTTFESQRRMVAALSAEFSMRVPGGGVLIPAIPTQSGVFSGFCAVSEYAEAPTSGGLARFSALVTAAGINTPTDGCCGMKRSLDFTVPTFSDRSLRYIHVLMNTTSVSCDAQPFHRPTAEQLRSPRHDVALVFTQDVSRSGSYARQFIREVCSQTGLVNDQPEQPWFETRDPAALIAAIHRRMLENRHCHYVLRPGTTLDGSRVRLVGPSVDEELARDERDGWSLDADNNVELHGRSCVRAVSGELSIVVHPLQCRF